MYISFACFSSYECFWSRRHVVAQPVETVDTVREDEAELPAEDPVVEVPVPETVTTAETVCCALKL